MVQKLLSYALMNKLMESPLLGKIIEASLDELIGLTAEVQNSPLLVRLYHSALKSYLKAEHDALDDLKKEAELALLETMSDQENSVYQSQQLEKESLLIVLKLIELRISIRQRSVKLENLELISKTKTTNNLWLGEIHFLTALAYGILNDLQNQKKHNLVAASEYEKGGAHRKSIKALQNAIATEGSIYPNKRLTVEYNHVLRKSLKLREFNVAGICAINISREYQLLGANKQALKFANLSLLYLKRDFGTIHYGLALCNRAHILFDSFRNDEAEIDMEAARIFDFPEIKAALLTLESRYLVKSPTEQNPAIEGDLAPSWINRCNRNGHSVNMIEFGENEEKIIRALSIKPMTREELIESVYPTELKYLDYETVLNRYKNLLARIRRKIPNLVIFENNYYSLSGASNQLPVLLQTR